MKRSITDILNNSGLSGMLLVTGGSDWMGMWLPLRGRQGDIRARRRSNRGDALARAGVANR
ncbi:MAG: hypothetical protein ACK5JR_21065 [Tropicimonas sp.]|uniref:hypothetical protein n=1 Tax=Tropicimonas sp. TaxID=2067044 RepID=UPI003A8A15E7